MPVDFTSGMSHKTRVKFRLHSFVEGQQHPVGLVTNVVPLNCQVFMVRPLW